jgi:hypothetical protein
MSRERCWNDTDRGKRKCWERESIPVPRCPTQIAHILDWDCVRASAARDQLPDPRYGVSYRAPFSDVTRITRNEQKVPLDLHISTCTYMLNGNIRWAGGQIWVRTGWVTGLLCVRYTLIALSTLPTAPQTSHPSPPHSIFYSLQ